jgi:hypothetical protein
VEEQLERLDDVDRMEMTWIEPASRPILARDKRGVELLLQLTRALALDLISQFARPRDCGAGQPTSGPWRGGGGMPGMVLGCPIQERVALPQGSRGEEQGPGRRMRREPALEHPKDAQESALRRRRPRERVRAAPVLWVDMLSARATEVWDKGHDFVVDVCISFLFFFILFCWCVLYFFFFSFT